MFPFRAVFISGCAKEILKDPSAVSSAQTLKIAETFPVNQADAVAINPVVAATFDNSANAANTASIVVNGVNTGIIVDQ